MKTREDLMPTLVAISYPSFSIPGSTHYPHGSSTPPLKAEKQTWGNSDSWNS